VRNGGNFWQIDGTLIINGGRIFQRSDNRDILQTRNFLDVNAPLDNLIERGVLADGAYRGKGVRLGTHGASFPVHFDSSVTDFALIDWLAAWWFIVVSDYSIYGLPDYRDITNANADDLDWVVFMLDVFNKLSLTQQTQYAPQKALLDAALVLAQ